MASESDRDGQPPLFAPPMRIGGAKRLRPDRPAWTLMLVAAGLCWQPASPAPAFVAPGIGRGCVPSAQPGAAARRVLSRAPPQLARTRAQALVPDRQLAKLLKSDLVDLDHRLMAAPYEIGAGAPAATSCFSLEQLQAEGGSGPVSRQLCEELRENHFALVSLGAPGLAAVNGVWAAARRFFELPGERKEDIAGRMRKAEGNVGVIGWGLMPDDNEFLEMRVTAGGEVVPGGIDEEVPGFTATTDAARKELFELSRTVIGAAETYMGMKRGALVGLLDDGSRLDTGQWSSTQHRLCLYHADASVTFEAHTDTTFATLIPCSSLAGLEVWTARSGWVRPEQHAKSKGAVVVMSGEMLQVLTAGAFPAAVHRVTRFASEEHEEQGRRLTRLSAPLLVRGVKEAKISSTELLGGQCEEAGTAPKLRETMDALSGFTLYDLHRTLVAAPPLDTL